MNTENGLIHAILLDRRGGGRTLDWTGIEKWTPELASAANLPVATEALTMSQCQGVHIHKIDTETPGY